MYLLITILKKSEFMAAQRARPILLNERFLVIYVYIIYNKDSLETVKCDVGMMIDCDVAEKE